MNSICIYTERGIYSSGEVVYGAIYLKIIRPTSAKSVTLKLVGTTKVEYDSYSREDTIVDTDYEVYNHPTAFHYGYYAFPFKITLPSNLTGSCFIENNGNPRYRLETIYNLTCQATKNISFSSGDYPIFIYQNDDHEPMVEPPAASGQLSGNLLPGLPSILRADLILNARLNKPIFEFGENMQLDLYTKNNTGKSVDSISVKLIRCLEINVSADPKPQIVQSILWGKLLPGSERGQIDRFESLSIPIPLPSNQEFSPTISNWHFKCYHRVECVVNIESNRQLSINLPISCILPHDNPTWSKWKSPFWLDRCKISPTESCIRVPDSELSQLHTASIPVLRHLSLHFL